MIYQSQNFRLESDDDVITLWLDFRSQASHSVNLPILNELSLLLDRLGGLPAPAAIVIRSRNPRSFLEELDVLELARMGSPLELAALARRGQEVVRKISELPATKIAMIEGRCAGFGLEVALACSNRLIVDSKETWLECSDLARGLIPFCGGTLRLPQIVGIRKALRLWLNMEVVCPVEALSIGLADLLTKPESAGIDLMTCLNRVRQCRNGCPGRIFRRLRTRVSNALFGLWVLRQARKAAGHSPAEAELVRCVGISCASEGEGLVAEQAALSHLGGLPETRYLLNFHHQAATPLRLSPEPVNPVPALPKRIGIVGAGPHGVQLARHLALRGHEIVVQERAANRGVKPFSKFGERVHITSEWVGFDRADFVIEAVTEDPGEKQNIFHKLEELVRTRTMLATTSTTIRVETLQAESRRPQRILGLHLPNLVGRSPVAEVVSTEFTHAENVAALSEWVRHWGFAPIRVADRPGRLVTLIRHHYLSEGVALVAEGLPAQKIDAACRSFGMTRGPLEWCDEIGFEQLSEQTAHLQMARNDGFARNLLFQRLIPYGCVGKVVGEGFYRYGLARRPNELARMLLWQDFDEDALTAYTFDAEAAMRDGIERVILRTVNEAAAALSEEPDSDPATVDLALAFGLGWAPQRGGPLRYADDFGIGRVVEKLAEFAERFGPRFSPCDELIRRSEAGETFYPCESPSGGKVLSWRVAI